MLHKKILDYAHHYKTTAKNIYNMLSEDEQEDCHYTVCSKVDERVCGKSGEWAAYLFDFPTLGQRVKRECGCFGTITNVYFMTVEMDRDGICSVDEDYVPPW